MSEIFAELNELEQTLIRSWVNQDFAAIEEILTDDWSVIDPSGRILTKAQVLEEAKTGERKLDAGAIDDVKVLSLGDDAAVVTGRTTATGSYEGNSLTVQLRFTDVCVKQNGKWRVIASQGTLIGG